MLTKQYTEKQWPFTDSPKTAVYTTRDIIEKGKPILTVTHDQDDGAWQFHTSITTWATDATIVALEEIVFHDPSVVGLSDLPIGWMAIRDSRGEPWVRQPIPSNVTAGVTDEE
ncbi:MAG TPA: hypothetical protein VEM40_13190 [Nitrospirota bacterium]|nr:hypothetical protein [Nitrospirota bacterium]